MILNLTHRDLDGVICTILLKKAFGKTVVKAGTYRNINDIFSEEVLAGDKYKKYSHIFMTDISINEDLFSPEVLKSIPNLHFIDHHPKEKESVFENKLINFNYSGCMLTQMYLTKKFNVEFSEKMKKLVVFGNDYDLWIHKYKFSKVLNRLYYYYNFDMFIDRFGDGIVDLSDEEKKFIVKNNNYIQDLIKNTPYVKLNNYIILAHGVEAVDEVCDYLKDYNDGVDTVFFYNTKLKTLSMRGNFKGVDYGVFLTKFGGGGHKEAAGCKVELQDQLMKIIETYVDERTALMDLI